jgi:hypothetical protein
MSKTEKLKMEPFDPSAGRKDKKVSLTQVSRMVGKRITTNKPVNFDYQLHLHFTWAPISKCYINYDRQRWPETTHIAKMYKKWNHICVTPLQARYSPSDDRYYIADGQQHGIAWVLQYGENGTIPVFYVESEDEDVESIQLLALNNDNEPMAKYFIHQQEVKMGVKEAVDLENCVINAGCFTGYKKRTAGVITHISDLWAAQKDYGLDAVGQVLEKMRTYWPTERIYTATMMGFLKVRELMHEHKVYDDEVFEEVFNSASEFYESAERLHLDIKTEFSHVYPTNFKGMGVREKVASGIIDAYEKICEKNLVPKPFRIDMPYIKELEDEEETALS